MQVGLSLEGDHNNQLRLFRKMTKEYSRILPGQVMKINPVCFTIPPGSNRSKLSTGNSPSNSKVVSKIKRIKAGWQHNKLKTVPSTSSHK